MPSSWITKSRRHALYERDGFRCAYCGRAVVEGAHGRDTDCAATLDHLTPRELGGGNESSNLVTACWACNSSKQDAPLAPFVRRVVNARLGADDAAHVAAFEARRTMARLRAIKRRK